MRWPTALLVAASATAALAGCDERLRPGFPHRMHLTSNQCGDPGQPACPTCVSCHEGVRVSEDKARPTEVECRRCHANDTHRVMAQVSHDTQRRTPIAFQHDEHLPLAEIAGQCVGCHGGVTEDGVNGEVFPDMATCTGCHDDALTPSGCRSCHQSRDLRRLVPETFLRHDNVFLHNHGLEAARYGQTCNNCHAESDCAACHDQGQPLSLAARTPERVDAERIHRADFVVRHTVEARSQPGRCLTCHTISFCDGCHVQNKLSGNARAALNPHPIGWIGPDPMSPAFHGASARRDIVSCAACHEQGPATNCIRCHSVGGPGGNPHPRGWRSLRSPGSSMCRWCHGG